MNALESTEVILEHVPVMNLQTDMIIGIEFTPAWSHSSKGEIPEQFLFQEDVASHVVVPFSRWMLREVCALGKEREEQGCSKKNIVTIESKHFKESTFVDEVLEAFFQTGLSPWLLEINLSHTTVMKHLKEAELKLSALQALGVNIFITDFKPGTTFLTQLSNLPIQYQNTRFHYRRSGRIYSQLTDYGNDYLTLSKTSFNSEG
nr:EAL domain-containing protein [Thalassobacillus sp. C254]